MKKNILGLVLLAMVSPVLAAQDQDRDRIQDQDRTHFVALNGEMLQLRDRAEIHLREKQMLTDGTVLYPNGSYEAPDGKRYKLRNGECLDADGILYRNELQYRNKVQQENQGLNPNQVRERNQQRMQYTFMDGNVYQVRNQEQLRLQTAMRLENGATAYPDGTYQLQNRERKTLQNGECLTLQGEVFRNLFQMRKQMLQRKQIQARKMLQKTPAGPMTNAKKKTT
ncbi:hypothetical protein OZ410_09045 [Robiginitalea sp. M366]|uniref:DUF6799 domain-containing protein n=1 Tax=Robiginitalea aestuariiviva TaxID=3036903 RepID=UPI00240DEA00|nr:DUF6799 domain-containing protein [Robiginitalea aestuariiviva]MDG1572460.1 hypothetical protein [Robiginitalea aestuariiviva]